MQHQHNEHCGQSQSCKLMQDCEHVNIHSNKPMVKRFAGAGLPRSETGENSKAHCSLIPVGSVSFAPICYQVVLDTISIMYVSERMRVLVYTRNAKGTALQCP